MEQGEYINLNLSSFDWTLSRESLEKVLKWHEENWDMCVNGYIK